MGLHMDSYPPRRTFCVIAEAQGLLGHGPHLADRGDHLEPLGLEDLGGDLGLGMQPGAKGDAQPFVAHLVGELADLLDPGFGGVEHIGFHVPVGVAFRLLDGGVLGELGHLGLGVLGRRLFDHLLEVEGGAEIGARALRVAADPVFDRAERTGGVFNGVFFSRHDGPPEAGLLLIKIKPNMTFARKRAKPFCRTALKILPATKLDRPNSFNYVGLIPRDRWKRSGRCGKGRHQGFVGGVWV